MRLSRPLVSALKEYETKLPKFRIHNKQFIVEESGVLLDKQGKRIGAFTPVGSSAASLDISTDKLNRAVISHHHPTPSPLSTEDINIALKYHLKEMRAVDPIFNFIHVMESPPSIESGKIGKIFSISKKCDASLEKIDKKYGLVNEKGQRNLVEIIKASKQYWKEINQCFRIRNKDIQKVDERIKFRTLPLEGKRIDFLED